MAAANESQGLKIAVAVFVALSVIFAVTTYFGFKYYGEAEARRAQAETKAGNLTKANSDALNTVEALRKSIGLRSESADDMTNEIKAERKKVDDQVKSMLDQVNAAVAKAQAAGAQGPELDEAKGRVQQVAAAFQSDSARSYVAALSRATDLMSNLALLTNQISLNYLDVRRTLESANTVNTQKLGVQEKAVTDAKADLAAEQQKHVDERQSLLTKVDEYQTANAKQATELANLTSRIRQMEDDFGKRLALAQQTIREYRDRIERKDLVLDAPDGKITFVDYNRGEVHANLTRGTGARPQMKLAIFDANSPGLPTDKPKGTIELTQVTDSGAIGTITKTFENIRPIAVGDHVYSPSWSPNEPTRFALIGKIDVNRDGVDDREDLKRMIEASGGIVDYDLPPPGAGRETGKLTGRDAWYVVDERMPFREVYSNKGVTSAENADHLKKQSEAIREARLNGVRPMPIERLLPYLGYDFHAPVVGRSEAYDTRTMKRVLMPRQGAGNAPAATAPPAEPKPEGEAPKGDAPQSDAPKEDAPKDEPK